MESYILITQLNDFIFCPRSIFFSGVYRNTTSTEFYHQAPQKIGQAVHAAVDEGRYSTKKNILSGITVYCEKYNLLGKIDIFNTDTGQLTERKYSVTAIYDGFRYQLYAQAFALQEMGYDVKSLRIYSVKDNKIYDIPLPDENECAKFDVLISKIRHFSLESPINPNPRKCANCIYNPLCDVQL